jgi:hypothetical protein
MLSLGLLTGRTYKLQEKPSAVKREQPALLVKMIFSNFFLFLRVTVVSLEPDPEPDCESGFGSMDPIECQHFQPNPLMFLRLGSCPLVMTRWDYILIFIVKSYPNVRIWIDH